jgi:C-terminal processing protease CtpA/Prc
MMSWRNSASAVGVVALGLAAGRVRVGDRLVAVDALALKGANWGAIFEALHGRPGAPRALDLERDGKAITVTAKVTAF